LLIPFALGFGVEQPAFQPAIDLFLHPNVRVKKIVKKLLIMRKMVDSICTYCALSYDKMRNMLTIFGEPSHFKREEMTTPLLKIQDVMRIFKISRRTVYYWIKNGSLQPIRMGKRYRFHPEDIDILIKKQREEWAQRKKRILSIDDDILVRESLKILLEREGFEVRVASSCEEALAKLSEESFDLVITDIRMPNRNGLETLQAIRAERMKYGKKPLPEIVLTAYEDEKIKEEVRKLGIEDFILKPFELSDFLATIRRKLSAS